MSKDKIIESNCESVKIAFGRYLPLVLVQTAQTLIESQRTNIDKRQVAIENFAHAAEIEIEDAKERLAKYPIEIINMFANFLNRFPNKEKQDKFKALAEKLAKESVPKFEKLLNESFGTERPKRKRRIKKRVKK